MVVENTCGLQSTNNEAQSLLRVPWSMFEDCRGEVTINCQLLELLARKEGTKFHRELEFSFASLDAKDSWELEGSTSVPEMVLHVFVRSHANVSMELCSYHDCDFFALLVQKSYLQCSTYNIGNSVDLLPPTLKGAGHLERQCLEEPPQNVPPLFPLKFPNVVDAKDCHADVNQRTTFEHDASCDINVHHELAGSGANALKEPSME